MTLTLEHVVFDCDDAARLAGFWSELLERQLDADASPEFASIGMKAGLAPALLFMQVPDKTPGKNVIHLDFEADDARASIDRAIGLGAKRIGDFDEYGTQWTTLADPEGNLFDIAAT